MCCGEWKTQPSLAPLFAVLSFKKEMHIKEIPNIDKRLPSVAALSSLPFLLSSRHPIFLLFPSSPLLFRLSSSLSPTENIRHEHKREGEETSFDEKGRVLTWITLEFRNRGKLAREEICKLRTQLRRLRQFPGCRLCRICFSRFQHLWTGSRWRRICLSS